MTVELDNELLDVGRRLKACFIKELTRELTPHEKALDSVRRVLRDAEAEGAIAANWATVVYQRERRVKYRAQIAGVIDPNDYVIRGAVTYE